MPMICCEVCGHMIGFAAGEEPDKNSCCYNDCVEITVSVKANPKKKAAVEKEA